MIWVLITLIGLIIDQASKYMVSTHICFWEHIPIIDGFFYLTYWTNSGAAWGIMQNSRWLLICLTVVLCIVISYYLYKSKNAFLNFSLSLILGGALGNLADRLFRGSVIDFLDFNFGSYHFPTFNFADSFIVIGTFLLAYYVLFKGLNSN